MTAYKDLSPQQLRELAADLDRRYAEFQARHLKLDMTRGKPSAAQLDLSAALFGALGPDDYRAADGTDCRNYGGLEGLPEARRLFGEILGVPVAQVLAGGNSSLNLMHDTIVQALLRAVPGAGSPWRGIKFLCPSPGYDRHFGICEYLGIDMIVVDMGPDGPDMDHVERLVAADATIKGIWCVPRYSNPTGVTYSSDVVRRLAGMKTAAPDFRIFWDNAYVVHHLNDTPDPLDDIMAASAAAGNPDRVFQFASTSKITFAGSGVAAIAASAANLAWLKKGMNFQTIGPDKLNHLRHTKVLPDAASVAAHMQRHAALLRPKFAAVEDILARELGGTGTAEWSRPNGGYFVSVDTMDGCAAAVVAMADAAGVKLTSAGATFPYGKDPRDRNIRLAPSMPSQPEIEQAMELFAVCVKRASIAKLLG
jgi:DNA-binding transcriptional MocR family regulator